MIRRCSVDEAVALVGSPGAEEELSVVAGCEALVVEGPAWTSVDLPDLPCVTVAVSEGGGWEAFDALVTDKASLPSLLDGITATPLASLALVQLFRAERTDPGAALWAESVTYGLLQGGPEFAAWRASHPPAPRPPSEWATVRVERDGPRVEVVLDRPEVHNALNTRMRDELVDAFRAVAVDASVQEVILRGEGSSFSSGGDLTEFGTFPDPVTAHAIRSTRLPARAVAAVRHRLTARVHGACVGAGAELAAFADRVVATPDARFQLPEVGMGLIPGSGGTWSVPARIGYQRAAWLALTGATIDAQDALHWGLVDEIEV